MYHTILYLWLIPLRIDYAGHAGYEPNIMQGSRGKFLVLVGHIRGGGAYLYPLHCSWSTIQFRSRYSLQLEAVFQAENTPPPTAKFCGSTIWVEGEVLSVGFRHMLVSSKSP